jgi:hypothetical protein
MVLFSKRKDGSNKTKYFLVIIKSCTIGTFLIGRTLDCLSLPRLSRCHNTIALFKLGQQKMLFQTFGTYLPRRITNVDKINVANISLLPLNKRLFALWEGGSAYEINPKTLATIGIQSWSPQTKGLPFGAHYRQDQDGSIWNIGG